MKNLRLLNFLRLFVLPQNHGGWKFENGFLCMLLVRTVSDYTCLSQACSEEGKAHTSIAFVPRYFFAGTRHSKK